MTKAASLFFSGQTDAQGCDVDLTDLTSGGAGIYKQGLAVLPLTFELAFDNLRQKCRLVWRKGNFFGVAFENQGMPSESRARTGEADIAMPEPAFSILNDLPQHSLLGNAELSSEWMPAGAGQGNHERGDRRFAIGVVVALALPVLISMSAYIATSAIMKVN